MEGILSATAGWIWKRVKKGVQRMFVHVHVDRNFNKNFVPFLSFRAKSMLIIENRIPSSFALERRLYICVLYFSRLPAAHFFVFGSKTVVSVHDSFISFSELIPEQFTRPRLYCYPRPHACMKSAGNILRILDLLLILILRKFIFFKLFLFLCTHYISYKLGSRK